MFSRLLYPFFLPGGLFLAAGILLLINGTLPPMALAYLPPFFPLVFLTGMFVSWRFQRSRLIIALLLLALGLSLCLLFPEQTLSFNLLALLLPFNLSLILLLPEKGLRSQITALFGSLILLQCLGGAWFTGTQPDELYHFLQIPIPLTLPFSTQPKLPQAISVATAILLALFAFWRRPQPLEAAFFWTIMLVTLPCYLQTGPQMTLLFFSLAGLNLLTGLLETSRNMAYRDELTGIAGRRAFNEKLARLGKHYCLAMLDIDHFKKFNDKHGHDVGDQVLKMVAARIRTVGGGGRAFRYGGEEFTIIFPAKNLEEALPHLEALREKIATTAFIPRGVNRPSRKPQKAPNNDATRRVLTVTISIGAAVPTRNQQTPEQALKGADQALYRAKQQGRNKVCTWA